MLTLNITTFVNLVCFYSLHFRLLVTIFKIKLHLFNRLLIKESVSKVVATWRLTSATDNYESITIEKRYYFLI